MEAFSDTMPPWKVASSERGIWREMDQWQLHTRVEGKPIVRMVDPYHLVPDLEDWYHDDYHFVNARVIHEIYRFMIWTYCG